MREGASAKADRAGGLRPEPAAQSQPVGAHPLRGEVGGNASGSCRSRWGANGKPPEGAGAFWGRVFPSPEAPTLRVLSHGGGVQTSTILFMADRGDIPPIDAAIMGDTWDEEQAVYDYLQYASESTRIPVILASKGNILEHIRRSKGPPDGKQIVTLPYFLADGGQMMRTCTKALKIDAVTAEIRKMLGLKKGQRVPKDVRVEVLVGISTDEKWRAGGFAAAPWQTVSYPLLAADMSFANCTTYLEQRQIRRPPRSRCRVCPYRSNESWRQLSPEDFEHACTVDDFLREGGAPPRGYKSLPYLHAARIPLRQVDLTRPDQLPMMNDCMGACGV